MSANPLLPPISVILLDEDPIFSLGLREALKTGGFLDINLVATGQLQDIFSLLESYKVDLWLVCLDLEIYPKKVRKFVSELPKISKDYPEINLLLLTIPETMVYDFKLNYLPIVKGYCYKHIPLEQLVEVVRLCGRGGFYQGGKVKPIDGWLNSQLQAGLREIDGQIEKINRLLENHKLSLFDLIYWQGRRRELKVARFLLSRFLPPPAKVADFSYPNNSSPPSPSLIIPENPPETTSIERIRIFPESFLENVHNNPLVNFSAKILEIDAFSPVKRKQLLVTILNEWNFLIFELKQAKIEEDVLKKSARYYLKRIWWGSLKKFLNITGIMAEEIDVINPEETEVGSYEEKLYSIPFVEDLLAYQVLDKPLVIDGIIYEKEKEESREMAEIIMTNLIITIANCVGAFILNEYAENPEVRQVLLEKQWKSSRKLAMFRNNLVWEYRKEKYWSNPKNIFEDKYELLILTEKGIETYTVNHPRHRELKELKGIPWLVTIMIELRDSLSRGVKSFGDFLGKLLVYLLTEVLGRGIGLIGKGILQGIGSRIRN
ncbi:MAG: DUF3685 domain-containing protein [Geminocystis sp.]|nr:DUF3685 domain-containing protein [Geminocystis sp.]MCS7148964.1 DUF3685 domain-containing protein [Geminocystis sp.]MDW8117189.1 DUF3685 domain-containing protein [Geminocystis sp.]MDW8462383.1 DUF3685 domain-containing protein [Geminocystis sp.]